MNMAESILSKQTSIKAEGLKELIEQQLYREMLPKLPHQLKHVEILRVYVLVPLIPNFYKGPPGTGNSSTNMLPIIYADRLQSLAPQLVSVVIRWLYHSPKEHLVRLISVYKKTVISVLENTNQSQAQVYNKTN